MAVAVTLGCVLTWAQGPAGGTATPVAKDEVETRSVSGEVMDQTNQPLGDAIVYLKNAKTLGVTSFITRSDGKYRFTALTPNVDYEIYAEHNGRKSPTKTLSAFESRPSVVLNLRIDTGK